MNRKVLVARGVLVLIAEFAALLFVSAGTPLWPAGWVFMAIFFGFALVIVLWLGREDPGLPAERLSTPIQSRQPHWDKVFVVAVVLLFVFWLILCPWTP
jgi:hypothetical protein